MEVKEKVRDTLIKASSRFRDDQNSRALRPSIKNVIHKRNGLCRIF